MLFRSASIRSAVNAFHEQHSLYLASKSFFDRKGPQTRASEPKRLEALLDVNRQLIGLVRKLAELRLAFDTNNLALPMKDAGSYKEFLDVALDRNSAMLSEVQSL